MEAEHKLHPLVLRNYINDVQANLLPQLSYLLVSVNSDNKGNNAPWEVVIKREKRIFKTPLSRLGMGLGAAHLEDVT